MTTYRVPLLSEIAALPWNGLTVASTFSGCGGSCLGYRWAGYRVLYANEFVAEARESYAPNFPGTYLDGTDIRDVSGADLMSRAGVEFGQLDLLDGSPPCQSFSTDGQRERGWGQVHAHADGSRQVSDDLFFEYARLLREVQPRTFVAENVSGLVKGTAKGYFKLILTALRGAGYRVSARLLDAQWLGTPQARQRLIFVGVRDDMGVDPVHPQPEQRRYSIRDALPAGWEAHPLTDPETGTSLKPIPSRLVPGAFKARDLDVDKPCPTIVAAGSNDVYLPRGVSKRKFSIAELRRICGFPDDFVLAGGYQQRWARLGNAVPPPLMRAVAATVAEKVLLPTA